MPFVPARIDDASAALRYNASMSLPFTASRPLWMLGCGNMAGAMLTRWLETGLDRGAVTVIDPGLAVAPEGVRLVRAAPDEPPPAALLLGVKPQTFASASLAIEGLAGPDTLVVSIMAGIAGDTLAARFPGSAVARLMPNLPVALGKGVAILHLARGDAAKRALVDALAAPLGLSLWVDSDAMLDAGSAVSGSGPAFVYRFIDALAQGAEALGFETADAARLALATVEGAAALAAAASDPPATLAERVASKGGSTRAGLDTLDGALAPLVERTLRASAARAAALARPLD